MLKSADHDNELLDVVVTRENSQHFATPLHMTCYYPDLGSAFIDWSKFPSRLDQSKVLLRSGWWHVISMEFLCSFLRRHFGGKPVVASRNVGCFLRLTFCTLWLLRWYHSPNRRRWTGWQRKNASVFEHTHVVSTHLKVWSLARRPSMRMTASG